MSEPTPAQEAYAADMALDAQIDAWYDANRKPVNEPDLSDIPDPEPPPLHPWYEDIGECVAFARWHWGGAYSIRGAVGEILDFFEKPWKFDEEHAGYKAEVDRDWMASDPVFDVIAKHLGGTSETHR